MSRFAAYKAEYVSAALQRALNDTGTPEKDRPKIARALLHTFNRYQDAERSTATARARTAKQFEEFLQPDNVRLFPNLKWLPSRSADPRQTHTAFYNKVWAKDDSFWDFNAPGTEWNCKCDIEETDEPVTNDNPQGITKQEDALPGIEGNPAKTGEVFTDNVSYIRTCSNSKKRKVEQWAGDKLLRKSTTSSMKAHQSGTVRIDKRGEEIDVLFDSKTTAHFSNDVAQSSQFLWNEVMDRMPQILSKSKLVAHELNTKLDKKPWAVEYFYYEYKTQHYTFYLSVEYNDIVDENRQFYRLYSITSNLRESATRY